VPNGGIYFVGNPSLLARTGQRHTINIIRTTAGRCTLQGLDARVESAWFQRLNLKHDTLLSSVAFNVYMRPCTTVDECYSDAARQLASPMFVLIAAHVTAAGSAFVNNRGRGGC